MSWRLNWIEDGVFDCGFGNDRIDDGRKSDTRINNDSGVDDGAVDSSVLDMCIGKDPIGVGRYGDGSASEDGMLDGTIDKNNIANIRGSYFGIRNDSGGDEILGCASVILHAAGS